MYIRTSPQNHVYPSPFCVITTFGCYVDAKCNLINGNSREQRVTSSKINRGNCNIHNILMNILLPKTINKYFLNYSTNSFHPLNLHSQNQICSAGRIKQKRKTPLLQLMVSNKQIYLYVNRAHVRNNSRQDLGASVI